MEPTGFRFTIELQWLDGRQDGRKSQRLPGGIFHTDGLVQERRNSSVLTMELRLFYTNLSILSLAIHLLQTQHQYHLQIVLRWLPGCHNKYRYRLDKNGVGANQSWRSGCNRSLSSATYSPQSMDRSYQLGKEYTRENIAPWEIPGHGFTLISPWISNHILQCTPYHV